MRGAVLDAVDLVEHQDLRQLGGPDFGEHAIHFVDVLVAARVADVDDVQQQRRLARLGERGLESRDQLMRQFADESHGIGHHHLGRAGQHDAAHGGIQRREQLVGDVGIGTRERAEQRRLAGVGVAHQRQRRNRDLRALLPAGIALLLELLQPCRQRLDALAQQTPVGLELRFAGTAIANAATALALEVGPAAHQARGNVLELRQLHFEFAFVAARALREDVEDQSRTIEHTPLDEFLEIAFLRGRQRMVEQHHLGVGSRATARISSALPLPTKKRGSGRSRRPAMFATGMAPAERASCSNSWMSSGSAGAPMPRRTSTARSPARGRSNTFECRGETEARATTPVIIRRRPPRSSFRLRW